MGDLYCELLQLSDVTNVRDQWIILRTILCLKDLCDSCFVEYIRPEPVNRLRRKRNDPAASKNVSGGGRIIGQQRLGQGVGQS